MAGTRKAWIGGNWKCNGTKESISELAKTLKTSKHSNVEVVVFPSPVYVTGTSCLFQGSNIAVGSQNVSASGAGAYTGEVSSAQLADCHVPWTLVGHSERRQYHQESSELVARKFAAAIHAGLIPVLCVGESL